jgi:hypothetical protein
VALNFRTLFKWMVPAWLAGEGNSSDTPPEIVNEGEILLYSLALLADAFAERSEQGLLARFPTRTIGSGANALSGVDRGIYRGRNESEEHYAQRLIRWRYPRGHRTRGSAFALLEQISEYWGGIHCYTIDVSGNRFDRAADGTETYTPGQAWDWDGEGATPEWARFWVVANLSAIATEQLDFGDPDLWGGSLPAPGYAIGQQGVTEQDSLAMKRLMRGRAWKPAGTRAEWLIVSLDGTEPAPDGTWDSWAGRDPAFRYWSFAPEINNVYAGDPTSFPLTITGVEGAAIAGDPTSFPASITLPSSVAYAGNTASFPVEIQLVDDGDMPQ